MTLTLPDGTALPASTQDAWCLLQVRAREVVTVSPFTREFQAGEHEARKPWRGRTPETPVPPRNAGRYADEMVRLLARIPLGCGRVLSCGPGWYQLLAELDAELERLFPLYVVEQVKEKYGLLRFYWDAPTVRLLGTPTPPVPPENPDAAQFAAYERDLDLWAEALERLEQTEAGRALAQEDRERRALAELFEAVAERRSAEICETCGQPGELSCSQGLGPWYRTSCTDCRGSDLTLLEWTAWREEEQPRQEARDRAEFIARHHGQRVLVLTADTNYRTALPAATYVHDPARAAQAAGEDGWQVVMLSSDSVGEAYSQALRARHSDHEQRIAAARDAAFASGKKTWINLAGAPDGCPTVIRLKDGYGRNDALDAIGVQPGSYSPSHDPGPLPSEEPS